MSLALALALSATIQVLPVCDWTDRGLDRFMGDVPSAVDTYTDIPADVRTKLKAKMQDPRGYEDIAHLTISGFRSERWKYEYPTMMHFGDGRKVCRTLDISKWRAGDPGERGLVYCVSGYCVTVFTVCRNVSRTAIIGPITPRPNPGPIVLERPPADIPDITVSVPPEVVIPPVEYTPTVDPLPPASFARQTVPDEERPLPDRISSSQSFYDLWARPLFWRSRTVPTPLDLPPALTISVPPTLVSFAPVPGVSPAPAVPMPEVPSPSTPGVQPPGVSGTPDAVAPVPEPATYVSWLLGLLSIAFFVRRSRKNV